jgi:hypothetical protein
MTTGYHLIPVGMLGEYYHSWDNPTEKIFNQVVNTKRLFIDVFTDIKSYKKDAIKSNFDDVVNEINHYRYTIIRDDFKYGSTSEMKLWIHKSMYDSQILEHIFMFLEAAEENYDFDDCNTMSHYYRIVHRHDEYIGQIKKFLWTELFLPKWIGVHQCIEWHPHKGIMQEQYNSILIT